MDNDKHRLTELWKVCDALGFQLCCISQDFPIFRPIRPSQHFLWMSVVLFFINSLPIHPVINFSNISISELRMAT